MKYLFKFLTVPFYLGFCVVLALNCNNMNEKIKGSSPVIVKDGSFVYVQLDVRPLTLKEIYADITFTNKSDSIILFYKTLLPLNGESKTNIFSIFDNASLKEINYTGRKDGEYLKLAPDDDEGVIIPDLTADNFVRLLPKQALDFTINLSKFYDFSKVHKGTSLSLAYSSYLPAVSLDCKQIFEKDTIDNKVKPVYYDLALPKNQFIDSMRVQFLIQ
jgi:hypothetical protein